MDWGPVVLGVQILLLVCGWVLFQQAKSDLTARAAQIPVLSDIKELQKTITALLEQLKLESGQVSAQLEVRCLEARELLTALDRRLEEMPPAKRTAKAILDASEAVAAPRRRRAVVETVEIPAVSAETPVEIPSRYQEVYALADEGLSAAEIARQTAFSAGEVELILGLRRQTS